MTKPAATKEPKVIFTLRVFAQPAMSRAIESSQIRHAMKLCAQEFGGGNGKKLKGEICVGYDSDLGAQTVVGDYEYQPAAPP